MWGKRYHHVDLGSARVHAGQLCIKQDMSHDQILNRLAHTWWRMNTWLVFFMEFSFFATLFSFPPPRTQRQTLSAFQNPRHIETRHGHAFSFHLLLSSWRPAQTVYVNTAKLSSSKSLRLRDTLRLRLLVERNNYPRRAIRISGCHMRGQTLFRNFHHCVWTLNWAVTLADSFGT